MMLGLNAARVPIILCDKRKRKLTRVGEGRLTVRELLLGIDLGTTVLKAGVFDRVSGRVRARAGRRLNVRNTADGGHELRSGSIDRAFAEVLTTLRQQLGAEWTTIRGVGLAAQGGSNMIVHRATGRACSPMMLWTDGRVGALLDKLSQGRGSRFWRGFSLFDSPPGGLARMWWMSERFPECFNGDHIHIGAGEHLFHKLTGVWRQDAGNAIQIGTYNARKRALDSALLDLIGVPLSFVAPLRKGHETSVVSSRGARTLGLSAGIPVAGPYIDQEAGYMAAAGCSRSPMQCSLGTAWVANFLLPRGTKGSSPTQLVLPAPVGEGRLVIQPMLAGNSAWDWGLQTLLGDSLEQALTQAAAIFRERLLPPPGLAAFPGVACKNPDRVQLRGAAAFHGMDLLHTPADLLRALAAGVVFEARRYVGGVIERGCVDSVVLGGGASKGAHFGKLFSSLWHPLPVYQQVEEDLSVAQGALYALSPRAAQARTRKLTLPSERRRAEARSAYEDYLKTFERVYGDVPEGRPFAL